MSACAASLPSSHEPPPTNHQSPERGWVVTSYRTYKGKKLGPYYARHWKVGKKAFKEYIKPEDVERVRAACNANRSQAKDQREHNRQTNRFLDNMHFMYKMMSRWEKGKDSTAEQYAYLLRIQREGMHISGRPPFRPRRKIVFGAPLLSKIFRAPWTKHPAARNTHRGPAEIRSMEDFVGPFVSNFTLRCLKRRIDPFLIQIMELLGIHPEEIKEDMAFTEDAERLQTQRSAIFRAVAQRHRPQAL